MSELELARYLARERWGRVTAFRVGVMVGEYDLDVPNPYAGEKHTEGHFEDGVDSGKSRREGATLRMVWITAKAEGRHSDMSRKYSKPAEVPTETLAERAAGQQSGEGRGDG